MTGISAPLQVSRSAYAWVPSDIHLPRAGHDLRLLNTNTGSVDRSV
jgi:hypothetical protein